MGTSSSNSGPGPGGGLLPPDAPPPPEPEDDEPDDAPQPPGDEPEDQPEPGDEEEGEEEAPRQPVDRPPRGPDWGTVKRYMTDFAKGSSDSPGKAVRGFVSAQGGGGGASAASPTGRATARNLGRFMAGLARDGLGPTAAEFGVQLYLGADTRTFLAALAEQLVPKAGGDEDDVARRAIARTLARLFDEVGVADASFEALEDLDPDTMATVLRVYITEYINGRLLQVLENRIVENTLDEEDALHKEEVIMDYVRGRVHGLLRGRALAEIDWAGEGGEREIHDIFRDAYRLLGEE